MMSGRRFTGRWGLTDALLLLLVIIVLWVFWKTYTVWLALVLAIAFTCLLVWVAEIIADKLHIRYGWALALLLILIGAVCTIVGTLVGPPVYHQSVALSNQVPQLIESTEQWLERRPVGRWIMGSENGGEGEMPVRRSWMVSKALGLLKVGLAALAGCVAVVAITLFLCATPKIYRHAMLAMVPPKHEPRARELIKHIAKALRWWLLGRLTSMLIVFVFTGLGLWILGLDMPWALGLIAGLLSFVPNIGPIVSAIPGVLLASQQGGSMVVWTLGVYGGVQLIESNVITPMVQRYAVAIPPALLLLVQLVLGVLFGIMGVLVATPTMVIIVVTIQLFWVRDELGRRVEVMGDHENEAVQTTKQEVGDTS
jgi:predicted PurR-regulated permease PerM